MTRERFIEHFVGRGWEAEIAGAVFDHFRSQVMSRDFGISPNDEIGPLFNQAEEDIEVDFKTILETLGLKEPPDTPIQPSQITHLVRFCTTSWM
jgi:hypothetical protein